MLKRFLSYYKPHKKLLFMDLGASFLVSAIAILYPMATRTMLNDLIPNQKYSWIVIVGCGLLLLYFVRMLLNYFIQYYGHLMGVRMQAQMRSDLFNHLEKLPFSFFDNNETGKIMSRMTSDLFDVVELAHHGPENLIISGISIILSFVYLCTITSDCPTPMTSGAAWSPLKLRHTLPMLLCTKSAAANVTMPYPMPVPPLTGKNSLNWLSILSGQKNCANRP